MGIKCLQELHETAPSAQNDATELVDLLSTAKAGQVDALLAELTKLGPSKPYLEFTLLTAMNTRGQNVRPELLSEFAKSSDFMVRQTACLIGARQGNRLDLSNLFNELMNADGIGCCILYGSLEELIGAAVEPPPPPAQKDGKTINEWKQQAMNWREAHIKNLIYTKEIKPGQAFWLMSKKSQ